MKALCFAALATAAFAQVSINSQYATASNGQCTVQPGFVITGYQGDSQAFNAPNSFPVASGTTCQIPAGQAVAVQCASGFQPVGPPPGVVATAQGAATIRTVTPTSHSSTVKVTGVPTGVATDEVTRVPTGVATDEVSGVPTRVATDEVSGVPTRVATAEVTRVPTPVATAEVTVVASPGARREGGFQPVGPRPVAVATAQGAATIRRVAFTSDSSTVEVTGVPTGVATDYNITSNTTFNCQKIVCNFTCTTVNRNGTSGVGCNSSGQILPGQSASSVCNAGYMSNSNFTCPEAGANATQEIVCSNSADVCTADNYPACAGAIAGGYALPGACNCVPGSNITCPTTNANSPICTDCVIRCDTAKSNTNEGLVLGSRQTLLTAASAAICPPNVDTIDEYVDCFQQAACLGRINPATDVCVFGRNSTCAQGQCPKCPESSKKGLLGLLGLLGLIPLLLCALLCCLLLCGIRRKKTERDVHFATFDAGAPSVATPMCEEVAPVCHDVSTVHHSTFVGPEHMHGGPVFGGPTVF